MKPPSEIIQDFIHSQNIGWVKPTNLFIGNEPESPTNSLTVFDTEDGWVQNPKLNYDMDHIQIRVRHEGYSVGWAKIKDISLLLNGISPFTYEDDKVEGVWVQVPAAMIGRDKKNNFIFAMTLRLLIVRNDKGNRQ